MVTALQTKKMTRAFHLFAVDRNDDGYLTTDELIQSAEEFFLSDEPQAPGNWLVPFKRMASGRGGIALVIILHRRFGGGWLSGVVALRSGVQRFTALGKAMLFYRDVVSGPNYFLINLPLRS